MDIVRPVVFEMTSFAMKHFPKETPGKSAPTKITTWTSADLVSFLNNPTSVLCIIDGYADFCKIVSFHNTTDAKVGVMKITLENYQYLRSGHVKREENELPYLSRWFNLPLPPPVAEYLHVVVYSREQLAKEGVTISGDWGIVTILAQGGVRPDPIVPSTILRNALGIEFGGSGVAIDRDAYLKSVEFWDTHAIVNAG